MAPEEVSADAGCVETHTQIDHSGLSFRSPAVESRVAQIETVRAHQRSMGPNRRLNFPLVPALARAMAEKRIESLTIAVVRL